MIGCKKLSLLFLLQAELMVHLPQKILCGILAQSQNKISKQFRKQLLLLFLISSYNRKILLFPVLTVQCRDAVRHGDTSHVKKILPYVP